MVNGLEGSEMASEYNSGLMVPDMRDYGKIIELMEKANSLILMETCMMANGSTIRLTGMVFITILMELCMRADGETIFSMERAKNHGLINLYTRGSTWLERSMEQVSIAGTTVLSTMENGTKIK